ncbi:hypothetical protein AK812_SmicGene38254 [Symbiodinium microadriaticum]|uniref:Uncharacterized protein n=1 Tax=Symbiodinium microadriaticum TaxID=2951 RepID=A0A1Q9CE78_SYMMI|nr:hypothetical protein AK812_SmicGene38254 [Symbiodinium microadriaticum]
MQVIQSTDFEVVFAISGSLPRNTQQDGSLAFWMGTEDCTKNFNEKALVEKVLRDRNMDWCFSGRLKGGPDFKGIAVIFLPFDQDRQTVAAVFSDGTRPIPTPLEDVLKDSRAKVVTSDWLPDKNTASTQAQSCIFYLTDAQVKVLRPEILLSSERVPVPNMFYGFTGYSGTKFGMEVNLNYLGTFNHDPHVVGEDGFSIAQSQQWKEALADEARFIDRVSQREASRGLQYHCNNGCFKDVWGKLVVPLAAVVQAIERLTKLLGDHVVWGSVVSQWSATEETV